MRHGPLEPDRIAAIPRAVKTVPGRPVAYPVDRGWAGGGLLALMLTCAPRATAEERDIRAAISDIVRSEHRYDPEVRQRALADAATGANVVELAPVLVNEPRLTTLLERFLEARRLAQEAAKPSLANGIAIERTIAGRPVIIGPQSYKDLLAEDARFNSAPATTPTWTLFDLKF